ncbi:hypothetical protein B0H14DRAFT_3440108 [Mycena olivaceomarginata]|nr:hypothetical protein B0H14DRAFT_3440108 [Mycena olivaceomarginata]
MSGIPSPLSMSEADRFKSNNFPRFKSLLLTGAKARGVIGYIDGTITKPATVVVPTPYPATTTVWYSRNPSEEEYNIRDAYTQTMIITNIDNPIGYGITDRITLRQHTPRSQFIQRVIAQTATPSWINSVPRNYGESNAGSIKADEWRTLATLYLPIALVLMWADCPADEHSACRLGMLDHSMALFQAVILVCRYTMTAERATTYRHLLKGWVEGLTVHHPHTQSHAKRPNIHVAFHIYDFLLLSAL